MTFLKDLNGSIHQNILTILSAFAEGDRYSNIDLLVGKARVGDPLASWFEQVDRPIFESRVPAKQKVKIARNAEFIGEMMSGLASVYHTSETGKEITNVQDASQRTGMQEAVAPFRQLFVLQIVRFWVELLCGLEDQARPVGDDIPFMSEIFAPFLNPDAYLRTRKRCDNI